MLLPQRAAQHAACDMARGARLREFGPTG